MTFLLVLIVGCLVAVVLHLIDVSDRHEIERRSPPPPAPRSPCRSQEEVDEILRAWDNRQK
jgi:hypothetical protein